MATLPVRSVNVVYMGRRNVSVVTFDLQFRGSSSDIAQFADPPLPLFEDEDDDEYEDDFTELKLGLASEAALHGIATCRRWKDEDEWERR